MTTLGRAHSKDSIISKAQRVSEMPSRIRDTHIQTAAIPLLTALTFDLLASERDREIHLAAASNLDTHTAHIFTFLAHLVCMRLCAFTYH